VTSAECVACGKACAVGLQIATRDRSGWKLWRYCGPCAVWLGETQDARTVRAIEQAERAGV
jgi:hypothetical protein